jgi:hypothetical protein
MNTDYNNDDEYRICYFRVFSWIIAAIISGVIWFYIGYYTFKLYDVLHPTPKIEFRHTQKIIL